MTIFKLVDRETGEESVEFAKRMVFQRPCEKCMGLKVSVNIKMGCDPVRAQPSISHVFHFISSCVIFHHVQ